jgi:endonuclease/exonuclease/phosphatase (EEP) superfamily protein YafD
MALNRIEVDGVLLGGDLNLVGTERPLQLLLEPLPSHYGSLEPVYAKHLDGKTDWTWDGRGSRFPSSQLDFAFYNASQLEVIRAFIFDTETMSSVLREKHGLDLDISKTLSDHRPIFVDYRWRL